MYVNGKVINLFSTYAFLLEDISHRASIIDVTSYFKGGISMAKYYFGGFFSISSSKAEKFINDLLKEAVDEFNYSKESERCNDMGETFIPEEYVRCSLRLGESVGGRFHPLVLLLPVSAVDGVDTIKYYINEVISAFLYKEEGSNKPLFGIFKNKDFLEKTGASSRKIDTLTSFIIPRIVDVFDDLDDIIDLGIDYPPFDVGNYRNIGVLIDPLRLFSKMLSSPKCKRPYVSIEDLLRLDSEDFCFGVTGWIPKPSVLP